MTDTNVHDDVPASMLLGAALQNEVVFRNLFDAAPDAVIVADENGHIVLVNLRAERLFGYARNELIGQALEVLVPERLRRPHAVHRRRFSTVPNVRAMGAGLDLLGRRRDGVEFPVEICLSPLATEHGVLVSASVRDISDRREREIEMRRLHDQLLGAVASFHCGCAIFDAEDRLVVCNGAYQSLLGDSTEGDLVGRTFEELLDALMKVTHIEGDETPTSESRAKRLAYHRAPSAAMALRTHDGRSLRFVERRTDEGGTVVTIWDITDDVERENNLREACTLAEAASSAKTDFLSSMSHELRTPLNAILGFSQLLARDKREPLSERHRQRITHVLKASEHLLRLIDEVLDLSGIEGGHISVSLEPVDVVEVFDNVKTTLDPIAASAGIELVLEHVSEDIPKVIVDLTRFRQVLMNFGSNAIKYGIPGGVATFRATSDGDTVRISVMDDGIGIPKDKHDEIFLPFRRAGQETGLIEGTGIGLAICKRLAVLMHGTVGFESTEGRGSTFWIDVPALGVDIEPPRHASEEPILESALMQPHERRHLIVYFEDNPSNIEFMKGFVEDFPAVVLAIAPTAETGIEIVRTCLPDIVLMDINLPDMSGFEATKRLRGWPETRDIPIVALSAAATIPDKMRSRDAGFYRYLTKPVKLDELTALLDELLFLAPS